MTDTSNLTDKLKLVLKNIPSDWLNLTTHRLDIYHEELAKTEFLGHFEKLVSTEFSAQDLAELPTAYDYIRLGHPLSSVFEWYLALQNGVDASCVISFQSRTMPILAILRKNLFANAKTRVVYKGGLPECLNLESLQTVYGYNLETVRLASESQLSAFEGTTIFLSENNGKWEIDNSVEADFYLLTDLVLGSVVVAKSEKSQKYVSEIQHVRRRESIAITPANCLVALNAIAGNSTQNKSLNKNQIEENRRTVINAIRNITATEKEAVIGSSGLSVQYAIMMGLVDYAQKNHTGKAIKFMVPPNCYGGTNDQARRVAACLENVEVVDLPVDREHDMVNSVEQVLTQVAEQDAVPYIIAEIPTNPRVEVPDLVQLKAVLAKPRTTSSGAEAVSPVFILDQTFCPNVPFLGENGFLSGVKTISYVSGSKFPSGGKCTAGYCVANQPAESLLEPIN
ncbi:MAG: PLP-dependent transferase, partial [Bacteroidetes bacterium]|nr:PLP-dependent transferase [Bacteroidota bacterium]